VLETDRELLDQYRRGERAALTRVFRHYADDVFRTVRAGVVVEVEGQRTRLGTQLPEHEVEGLVHETFLKAFSESARASYDGLRPFGAWLATIARNVLIDRARKLKQDRRLVAIEDVGEPVAEDTPDPTWRIEDEQLRAVVEEVRAALEEPDLSIFRLRFDQQKSFRETAEALGVTEIVVRRRETRLRVRLLSLLQDKGFLQNRHVKIGTSLLPRSHTQRG
jgi:RNA polymerase sigma factor (sigma-70 family)